jgi:Replication initiation and membrane attachment protein (DnaB).
MPDTEHKFISVYIFGLYLSCSADNINTIETMENALNLTEEEIHLAYNYWEELGICVVLDTTPFTVVYNNINNGEVFRKIKPNKYKTFNKGIQTQLTGRMITPSEFNEYYTFLEDSFFEPEALLAVAKYCVALKGDNVSYNYILAVARNLSKNGIRTEEAVNDRLNKPLPFINELKEVFKALKIRRQIDFSDRDLLRKMDKGLRNGIQCDYFCC